MSLSACLRAKQVGVCKPHERSFRAKKLEDSFAKFYLEVLRVNFMCQIDWSVQIFCQTLFWVFSWGYSWMGLTFKLVGKQIALSNMGGPQPISWRTEQNQKAYLFLSRTELLLPDFLWTGSLDLSCLWTLWNIGFSWVSTCQLLDWNYPISFPVAWLTWPWDFLACLTCVDQFLTPLSLSTFLIYSHEYISYIYICIYLLLASLENPD